MALLKLCRCGRKVNLNQSMCNVCQGKKNDRHISYDKSKRDKSSSNFYHSKEWRKIREQVIVRDNGLCLHCLENKRFKKADVVDHIIPIKEEWELRLNPTNLQSLCHSCHNKKTAEDKGKYSRGEQAP